MSAFGKSIRPLLADSDQISMPLTAIQILAQLPQWQCRLGACRVSIRQRHDENSGITKHSQARSHSVRSLTTAMCHIKLVPLSSCKSSHDFICRTARTSSRNTSTSTAIYSIPLASPMSSSLRSGYWQNHRSPQNRCRLR